MLQKETVICIMYNRMLQTEINCLNFAKVSFFRCMITWHIALRLHLCFSHALDQSFTSSLFWFDHAFFAHETPGLFWPRPPRVFSPRLHVWLRSFRVQSQDCFGCLYFFFHKPDRRQKFSVAAQKLHKTSGISTVGLFHAFTFLKGKQLRRESVFWCLLNPGIYSRTHACEFFFFFFFARMLQAASKL